MAAPNQNDAQVDAEVEPTECSICLSNPSDHIIIPCGHQCGCKECLTQLKQSGGKCPMCRGRINIVQKVYASHNVRIKQKPAEQKNDENAWPEDVEDDEQEEEKKEEALDDSTEAVTIRIAPACVERKQNEDIYNVVLELVGSEKRGRCPVDVCAVLDTSGSMCSSAAVQEDDGSVSNDDGLSRLDCVKHSVKAVMNCLSKKDRFSIVSFESKAKLVYKLSYMDKTGIKHATNALEKLQPAGQTNLWEGLRQGLESLRTNRDTTGKRLSVIMLLTDGCPTMIPPKGELHELTNYMDQHNFSVQINTFGFGYDLDSELMHSLSMAGHGTFAFIPDARIVGTTFVNSVSNVLTTIFPMTKLSLTAMNGSKFVGPSYGAYTEQDESWGRAINIGPIMGGAARYLSIPMSVPKNEQPYLEAQLSTTENKVIKTVQATQRNIAGDLLAGHLTAKVVTVGFQATDLAKGRKGNAAIKLLAGLKKEVREAADVASKMETDNFDQMTANSRLEALNKDVQGRLAKAFNGEARFNRWGKHYLRALLRAHQLNMCTNFMDPGLQVNGGNLFRSLRAKGDEVFINLPPPKPSRRRGGSRNYYQAPASNSPQKAKPQPAPRRAPSPQPDMSSYYAGASGGCFAPYCSVNTLDAASQQIVSKQVCEVRPGDQVQVVGNGEQMKFAIVLFAVELSRDRNRRMIRFPSGLVITGGHPVRRNGIWCVPRKQKDVQHTTGCERVFAFVLDQVHIMIVNGMECVTWAHNLRHVAVKHSVFGTDRIIQSLKQEYGQIPLNNIVAVHQ